MMPGQNQRLLRSCFLNELELKKQIIVCLCMSLLFESLLLLKHILNILKEVRFIVCSHNFKTYLCSLNPTCHCYTLHSGDYMDYRLPSQLSGIDF